MADIGIRTYKHITIKHTHMIIQKVCRCYQYALYIIYLQVRLNLACIQRDIRGVLLVK